MRSVDSLQLVRRAPRPSATRRPSAARRRRRARRARRRGRASRCVDARRRRAARRAATARARRASSRRSSSSSSASAASSASSAVARRRARDRLLLQRRRAPRRRRARCPTRRTARASSATIVERLGELRGRAPRRRGRVVELVREAGGHRAQRGQPLAVLLDAVRRLITGAIARITRRCTAGCAKHEARGSPRAGRSPARHAVSATHPHGSGSSVSTAIAPIQVGAVLVADRLEAAAARPAACSARALEQQDAARARGPAPRRSARRAATSRSCATASHSASCVVVDAVEQVDRRAARRA